MSAKHTPKPWSLSPDSTGRLVRLNRPGCIQEHLQVEPPEDAQLIFAAPDLADALEALLREHNAFDFEGTVESSPAEAQAFAALRAAGRLP